MQSFTRWEQIIIDDGSTDQTFEIAKATIGDDPRFTLIKQENKGVFRLDEIYNKALSYCKGEYVAILEGDDYWEPEKLTWQMAEFEKNDKVVLVWGKAYARTFNSKDKSNIIPKIGQDVNKDFLINKPICSFFNFMFFNFCPPLTFVINKKILTEINGFHQILPFPAIDFYTTLLLSCEGEFVFIDKPLGTWRINPIQTSKKNGIEIFQGSKSIVYHFLNTISSENRKSIFISDNEIENSFKCRFVITYSRAGRFALINKQYLLARKYYYQSLGKYIFFEPIWKLRSLVGLIFSFIRCDVEYLAKIFGKGSFKS
jgi:glycosyltransferase involved in cell wall biosynthesis